MTVKARDEVQAARDAIEYELELGDGDVMGAVDALIAACRRDGDARELKGHVEACGIVTPNGVARARYWGCGDGHLCDQAKQLGGSQ